MSQLAYGHVSAWLKYLYTGDGSVLNSIPTQVLQTIASSLHRSAFNCSLEW
jgi:hypothetical protein